MEVIGWYFMWQTSLIPTGTIHRRDLCGRISDFVDGLCVGECQTLSACFGVGDIP